MGRPTDHNSQIDAAPSASAGSDSVAPALNGHKLNGHVVNGQAEPDPQTLAFEVAELRAKLAEAERQLGNIRQTFIYRIGEAVVSARSWRGFRRLPSRLVSLRRAFLEKRRTVEPAGGVEEKLSERLRYVDEALSMLAERGVEAAAARVRSMPGPRGAEKSRALAELAHAVCGRAPAQACALALEAARLNPSERRLRPLLFALMDQGELGGAGMLLRAVDPSLLSSVSDQSRCAEILAYPKSDDEVVIPSI